MVEAGEGTPARRSDALRNRASLLAAAAEAFAEHGSALTTSDVARRAGVSKATVFSHFASKSSLLQALVDDRVAELASRARDALETHDPPTALVQIVRLVAEHAGPLETMLADSHEPDRVTPAARTLTSTIDEVLRRAQSAGAVRTDVDGVDVLAFACAASHVPSSPGDKPTVRERYLEILVDGLRPPAQRST